MKKLLYEYVIQEYFDLAYDCWIDRYVTNDRYMIENMLRIFRKKNPGTKYRVVRLVL